MKINPRSLNKVLNIYVYGSSGTYLLQSILDNHPHILMMPIPQFIYYYDFYDNNRGISGDELLSRMVDQWGVLFDAKHKRHPDDEPTLGELHGLDRMGPNKDQELRVDKDKFVSLMQEFLAENKNPGRKYFFQACHVAYAEALGRTLETPEPWIVYQLHWPHPVRTSKVIEDFPDARFIHMIRHPAKSLASFFNGLYLGRGFDSNGYAARCIDVILRGAPPVLEENRKRTRAIKLESLHTEAEPVMRRLTEWLDIPWDKTLLESTYNGLQWWSVPSRKGDLSGFSPERVENDGAGVMSALDNFKIKALLHDSYARWGYSSKSRIVSLFLWILCFPFLWLPFRIEFLAFKHAKKNEGLLVFLKHVLRIRILSYQAWVRRGVRPFLKIKGMFLRWALDVQDPATLL